jgi:hypothetical protein
MGLSGKVVIEIIRGVMNESRFCCHFYWMMNKCRSMKKKHAPELMFGLWFFSAYSG